jgi:hypothetical protein
MSDCDGPVDFECRYGYEGGLFGEKAEVISEVKFNLCNPCARRIANNRRPYAICETSESESK